jgi:hypothetical protein
VIGQPFRQRAIGCGLTVRHRRQQIFVEKDVDVQRSHVLRYRQSYSYGDGAARHRESIVANADGELGGSGRSTDPASLSEGRSYPSRRVSIGG